MVVTHRSLNLCCLDEVRKSYVSRTLSVFMCCFGFLDFRPCFQSIIPRFHKIALTLDWSLTDMGFWRWYKQHGNSMERWLPCLPLVQAKELVVLKWTINHAAFLTCYFLLLWNLNLSSNLWPLKHTKLVTAVCLCMAALLLSYVPWRPRSLAAFSVVLQLLQQLIFTDLHTFDQRRPHRWNQRL